MCSRSGGLGFHLLVTQLIGQLTAAIALAGTTIFLGIEDFGLAHQGVELLLELLLGPEHALVAHGFVLEIQQDRHLTVLGQLLTRRGMQQGGLIRLPGAKGLAVLHAPFSRPDPLQSLGSGQIQGVCGVSRVVLWATDPYIQNSVFLADGSILQHLHRIRAR
ncbi:hypothetical protein [Synechococcus sp. CBW1006]|uniref:hypothetical protein n=1 Tax=Synechococcus sp. CBW1006 TaxID=1353138 RepID=UPI0018CF50EF|nr:hypothetical protein [Synechococcus sp. CBW1006]QPN66572.1 hypothetical protein H8F26_17915 [Synechococcus sp. CBW1006]